ncbi:MAG: carboxypeptidase-like regulatory domain-containing protein [Chloroflexota bacterium]
MMITKRTKIQMFLAFLILLSASCSLFQETPAAGTDAPIQDEPTDAPVVDTPRPTVNHLTMPSDPPAGKLSEINDKDSSAFAAEKRTNGGENYNQNLFERPFNANSMDTYFPDLDIVRTYIGMDSEWYYVTIQLVDVGSSGTLGGNYGVEIDRNVDGRGDVLIFASQVGNEWTTDGVTIWMDDNGDVGGNYPMNSEAPLAGDGYENKVFDSGLGSDPDAAWARLDPGNPSRVQIAFKQSVIEADYYFTWGVWADQGVFNPAWFDYSDHFTDEEAGSPLVEMTDFYPIKALFELDNTCRWAVGFTPTGTEPGICPVPVTPTPESPGTISGTVYFNGTNSDLSYHPYSTPASDIPVTLRSGTCASPGGIVASMNTNGSGNYSFSVSAGTYCVSADTPSSNQTGPQTVTVSNGGSATADFFYYYYLGIR